VKWYVVSFVVLISFCNLILYYFLNLAVQSERNSILNDRFNAIASLLKSDTDGSQELRHRITEEWPSRGGEMTFFQLIASDGQVLAETPGFDKIGFPKLDPHIKATTNPSRLDTTEGRSFFIQTKIVDGSIAMKNPVRILGAIDSESGDKYLSFHREASIAIVLISAIISLALGWQITNRGLSPLGTMTKEVEKIGTHTLKTRLDSSALPSELHPLANAFNQTLDRLEQSFSRLSRFSSDIAHELRTPVTNILGELEVSLKRPRSENEYREVLTSTLEECVRLKCGS
jgi:two-component system heavy metal sensor histidine kinase CusS